MGSPFGERQSLSVGVISGLDRTIESLTQFQISGAIQTDAAINRGISGGPLLDARGRVVGINAQTSPDGAGRLGRGVRRADRHGQAIAEPVAGRRARRNTPIVGVSTVPLYPQLARHLGLPVTRGALVQEVVADGPAAEAGIRAGKQRIRFQGQPYRAGGDVIVTVAGKPIRRESDVGRVLATHAPGETVTLQVLRGGGSPRRSASRLEANGREPARPGGGARARAARARAAGARRPRRARGTTRTRRGRRRHVRHRRRRRGVPRGVPGRARAGASPSTPRTAAWSRRTARRTCSSSTRSTGRGRRWPGSRRPACRSPRPSWATGRPTMADVAGRRGRGDQVGTALRRRARRGAARATRRCALSANQDLDRLFWVYGLRGRPARETIEVLGRAAGPLVGRAAARSTSARPPTT